MENNNWEETSNEENIFNNDGNIVTNMYTYRSGINIDGTKTEYIYDANKYLIETYSYALYDNIWSKRFFTFHFGSLYKVINLPNKMAVSLDNNALLLDDFKKQRGFK